MKRAADFRRIARSSLCGKWMIAVLAGLIAVLLGGAVSEGMELEVNIDDSGTRAGFSIAGIDVFSWEGALAGDAAVFLAASAVYLLVAALVLGVARLILGSVVAAGYAKFNLTLTGGGEPAFSTLFDYFPHWRTMLAARLLQSLYIILWVAAFYHTGHHCFLY